MNILVKYEPSEDAVWVRPVYPAGWFDEMDDWSSEVVDHETDNDNREEEDESF